VGTRSRVAVAGPPPRPSDAAPLRGHVDAPAGLPGVSREGHSGGGSSLCSRKYLLAPAVQSAATPPFPLLLASCVASPLASPLSRSSPSSSALTEEPLRGSSPESLFSALTASAREASRMPGFNPAPGVSGPGSVPDEGPDFWPRFVFLQPAFCFFRLMPKAAVRCVTANYTLTI
jgi:hypothetical protein